MLTVLAAVAALAVLFAAGALITHDGDLLREAPADAPDLDLPRGQLQPEDVAQLRFGLALRGYRMDEVDTTLALVASELTARDQQIAQLQQDLAAATAASAQVDNADEEAGRTQGPDDWGWPESTSVVSESPEQVHAPTPDLFPEIELPEPVLESSFGLFDQFDEPEPPLGDPGVGFASSGGGAPEPVADSLP